jgi:hypothetical protein
MNAYDLPNLLDNSLIPTKNVQLLCVSLSLDSTINKDLHLLLICAV